jgi:hypothetical protein
MVASAGAKVGSKCKGGMVVQVAERKKRPSRRDDDKRGVEERADCTGVESLECGT